MRGSPNHAAGNQITGPVVDHVSALAPLLAWFDAVGCAVHLRVPGPALDGAVGERLAALGFAAQEVEAWMAAPLHAVRVEAPAHDIRPVDGPQAAAAFGRAFAAGWEIADPGVAELALAAMAPWPAPPAWRRYVAWVDGQPAGEALLVQRGGLAYLAEAATVPAYRRRGIQRARIARRAEDARASGATMLFGAAQYGDASCSNMRAMGLREAFVTVRFKRPAGGSQA